MSKIDPVITGIGLVAPNGLDKNTFWENLEKGKSCVHKIKNPFSKKPTHLPVCEVRNFNPEKFLGPKGLRNLDKSALFSLCAAQNAINDAQLKLKIMSPMKPVYAPGAHFHI